MNIKGIWKSSVVVVVTLFPTEKQSTAYMNKDTYVNQYTLMFCWWSPEKPKAYLAGNQILRFSVHSAIRVSKQTFY